MSSDDVTRLATDSPAARTVSGGGTARGSGTPSPSTSGWLSSSGSIDHGRFTPGTVLGGRYRIIGKLGKGGMGEVFRADDLKLGQPVALKFLPQEVDDDPARLTQLHTEVRMARQVSHPNVCRVYDIDEVDGHTFLSMEYVDGEDLSSLLKRIGRFPEDRALEIARQVCAGLAAAHSRGVIHRDFKPANVMLDGAGHVRITDFGLAGLSGETIRAGTPAYMAPEQLAGGEVTARSDVYSLGLVLYEIFTGRRALEGNNLAELIRRREHLGITPPTAVVRDLSPEIERAIMRCLEPDPASRPASALAVSAALPGGDPLAAALAAGETPSPEMVAAAGTSDAISARVVIAATVFVVLGLLAITAMYQRVLLINRLGPVKSPIALQDRAEEILQKLGYADGAPYRASGLGVSQNFARYLDRTSTDPDRWSALGRGRPPTLFLWHRASPRPLVPFGDENPTNATNPPLAIAGMALVIVDGAGRLAELIAVPEPIESGREAGPVDWSSLFTLAGLDITAFTPVEPQYVPVVYADERRAWEGPVPEDPNLTLRVEASAMAGRPVSFVLSGSWARSARTASPLPQSGFTRFVRGASGLIMPSLMLAAAFLAWGHLRSGRGDRRGATRAALAFVVIGVTAWVLGMQPTGSPGDDMQRFFGAIGSALFDGGLIWLTYLGLEPYIRRFSPDSLIGWTRLLTGRWRDPLVASDILIGICAGVGMTLLFAVHNLLPPLAGRPEPMPIAPGNAFVLLGSRFVIASMLSQIGGAVSAGLLAACGTMAILLVVKRKPIAHVVASLVFVWVVIQGMFPEGTPLLDLALGLGMIGIWTAVILYAGLLSTVVALATHFVLLRAPITMEVTNWRATPGLTCLVIIAGVTLTAAVFARRPALQRA